MNTESTDTVALMSVMFTRPTPPRLLGLGGGSSMRTGMARVARVRRVLASVDTRRAEGNGRESQIWACLEPLRTGVPGGGVHNRYVH